MGRSDATRPNSRRTSVQTCRSDYREDPRRFLNLSKQAVDSALTREIVAELRNEGHVEEDVRGTIRLTPRDYGAAMLTAESKKWPLRFDDTVRGRRQPDSSWLPLEQGKIVSAPPATLCYA